MTKPQKHFTERAFERRAFSPRFAEWQERDTRSDGWLIGQIDSAAFTAHRAFASGNVAAGERFNAVSRALSAELSQRRSPARMAER